MFFFAVMVACLAGATNAVPGKLPEYFPTLCARDDPQLSQCAKANFEQIFPRLLKGDPDLGIDVLDPLAVSEVNLDLRREPVVMKMVVRDGLTYGLSSLRLKDLIVKKIDNDSLAMEVYVFVPKMLVEGQFKLDGHIGSYAVNGKGPFNISLTGINGIWRISGSAVELDGERYMQIKSFYLDYTLNGLKVHAENLVQGAPGLSSLVLQLINQFWPAIFHAVDPYTREPFSSVLSGIANKVFLRVPYDQLFPLTSQ